MNDDEILDLYFSRSEDAIGADRETYVVMKDGSRVETFESGRGSELHNLILDPQAPIVVEEVDHLLLPDGTKIPMP